MSIDVKLQSLMSKCKCGVYLAVNAHRDYYETAKQKLTDLIDMGNIDPSDIDSDVFNVMIDTNTIVELTFYPDTPIGSYTIYHYDLNIALDKALNCFKQEGDCVEETINK